MNKKINLQVGILVLIILIAFFVRLYKISNPVADWHSWRQADTAAVARHFYNYGFNPFVPKYDDMSGVAQNPVINPERYRFVEFPIYNSLVYFAYVLNGSVDERLARLTSILFSLGSTLFVFFITRKYFGKVCALMAAFIYAILPFNIYFSRVILPEPSLVFFSLGMFYFVDRWIRENRRSLFLLAVFFTAAAFLTKPMAVFYLLPLFYVYLKVEKKLWPVPKRYIVYLLLSFAPFFGWRLWIGQHPEGIPASNWLFNGNGIRFKPAFWRWILGDRFGREILSLAGFVLFSVGLLIKPKVNEGILLHLLGISSFLYLIVFATGNVQHDYYQYLIVPVLSIFTARGFVSLISGVSGFVPRIWTIPLALIFLPLTFILTWNEVKGLYQINNPVIVEAGQVADRILPKDALVIASYNGDSSFLYQTKRAGFPNSPLPVPELVSKYGIDYYISTAKDDKTNWLSNYYEVKLETPDFVIIDLTKQIKEFSKDNPEPN